MTSAALTQGLKSIALSSSDEEELGEGLAGVTDAGITFGSVEPSFHSEVYEDDRARRGTNGGHRVTVSEENLSCVLFCSD
jgi:hypothetical protein